jgi:hypothetical protein
MAAVDMASCRSESRRPSARMMRVVNAIIPSPPSWMSSRMNACPVRVK